MRFSLYEVETVLRKATIGAGFPVGLAEECGQAGAWLCAGGYDGVAAILSAVRDGMRSPVLPVAQGSALVFSQAPVAVSGPSAIDLLLTIDQVEVRLIDADAPMALLGLAGVAAGCHGLEIIVDLDGTGTALITGDDINLQGSTIMQGSAQLPLGALSIKCQLEDRRGNKKHLHTPSSKLRGARVDSEIWREALALASRTYVPASDASRSAGAGAGLTDND